MEASGQTETSIMLSIPKLGSYVVLEDEGEEQKHEVMVGPTAESRCKD